MIPYLWLFIGLLFIFIEFFLPGGVFAILGISLVFGSVFLFAWESPSPLYLLLYLVGVGLLLAALVKFALGRVLSTRKEGTIYSDASQEGYVADSFDRSLLGAEGVTVTDMRPAGRIRVAGRTYEALAENGFIDGNSPIVIVDGQGATFIVKLVKKDSTHG